MSKQLRMIGKRQRTTNSHRLFRCIFSGCRVVSLADLPEEDIWLAKQKAKAPKHPPCLQARRRTFHAHADDPLTTSPGEPPGRHLRWLSLEKPSITIPSASLANIACRAPLRELTHRSLRQVICRKCHRADHLVRDQRVGGSNPLSPTNCSQLLTDVAGAPTPTHLAFAQVL